MRAAQVEDAPELARVQNDSWRATYRGLMPAEILDDPSTLARMIAFYQKALSDPNSQLRIATALTESGRIIGVAQAGPPRDADAHWSQQLDVIYTDAAYHGQGVSAKLIAAVLDLDKSAAVWTAKLNPRAIAFYQKHGFVADGARLNYHGTPAIRMLRLVGNCG